MPEPVAATNAPSEPVPVPKPPADRKPRAKGTGRKPVPDHLPETEVRGEVCACGHCGSERVLARDTERTKRIDVTETIAKIRHDVAEVVFCKDCGRTTTAPLPPLPCVKSKFTCGFIAWLVTMKFLLLVPLEKQPRDRAA